MINRKSNVAQYRFVFKVALLVSIMSLTLLFYLFPKFPVIAHRQKKKLDLKIYVSDIPLTLQKKPGRPLPPRKPTLGPFVAVEDAELPEMLPVESPSLPGSLMQAGPGKPVEVPARPLLEYYPSMKGKPCQGEIQVLILINANGKVEDIQIVKNTTIDPTCLQRVKEAIRKTRWIPAKVGGKNVASWVSKTYKFNLK